LRPEFSRIQLPLTNLLRRNSGESHYEGNSGESHYGGLFRRRVLGGSPNAFLSNTMFGMAKKKTNPDLPSDPHPTFEQSLEQLQSIVHELEDGGLSLSDSLEKYELGVKNLRKCYHSLESAQKKIELLVELDEDGNLVTEPFDDTATTETARKTTRQSGGARQAERSGQAKRSSSADKVTGKTADDDDMDEPVGLF
jgi:exodeoxyribonuclease VII small subunit